MASEDPRKNIAKKYKTHSLEISEALTIHPINFWGHFSKVRFSYALTFIFVTRHPVF